MTAATEAASTVILKRLLRPPIPFIRRYPVIMARSGFMTYQMSLMMSYGTFRYEPAMPTAINNTMGAARTSMPLCILKPESTKTAAKTSSMRTEISSAGAKAGASIKKKRTAFASVPFFMTRAGAPATSAPFSIIRRPFCNPLWSAPPPCPMRTPRPSQGRRIGRDDRDAGGKGLQRRQAEALGPGRVSEEERVSVKGRKLAVSYAGEELHPVHDTHPRDLFMHFSVREIRLADNYKGRRSGDGRVCPEEIKVVLPRLAPAGRRGVGFGR